MRRLYRILKVLGFVQAGAGLLRVVLLYNDYTRHRELYATYSSPWYTDILITVALTAVMVGITFIACCGIKKLLRKREEKSMNIEK